MGKTVPPETLDLANLPYDPMYAANGEVVMTANGKPVSAKLTQEQEEQIIVMLLDGKTVGAIAKELRTTTSRIQEYTNKPRTADAIAYRAITTKLVRHNEALVDTVVELTRIVEKMSTRLSAMNSKLSSISLNSMRQKHGRLKAETTLASTRADAIRARRYLHKRTGRTDF